MSASNSGLIVICGPTASGKSALALQLAQDLKVPLINADSRQIYRHFNIGTAKPTVAEQAQWPHHLIDIADPTETYTVVQYQQRAEQLINATHHQGKTPILVGGTGLYVQALTEGLAIPAVAPNPQLRHQLEALPQSLRHNFLCQVDKVGAKKIHPHDVVRTVRALEVYYSAGQPMSELQRRIPPSYTSLILGLKCCNMEKLAQRIAARTERMLETGWLEEVLTLRDTYGADLPLLQTLGYRELGRYLDGAISLAEAKFDIVKHTRQFAKRQMTWFRRTPGIIWFDRDDPNLLVSVKAAVHHYLERLQNTREKSFALLDGLSRPSSS